MFFGIALIMMLSLASCSCHVSCMTKSGETYGQVMLYRKDFTYGLKVPADYDYNVTLVTDMDSDGYFERYPEAIR